MPSLTTRPPGTTALAYRADSPCPADELLLVTLLTTWVLVTGRTPPAARPDQLSPEELIAFWADDRM